ncbi:MAG: AzlD domain-containing protein, partial [Acetobacteraceae bacterium]|nr:AzlD domain-containing protein [Acetobacteraceae bacterium]
MGEPEAALALLILACAAMRGAGLLVAGRLRPDHPLVQWAASVALATLAAFVLLAIVAPGG